MGLCIVLYILYIYIDVCGCVDMSARRHSHHTTPNNPTQCYTHKRWQLLKPVLRAHLQAQAATASTKASASSATSGSEGGPTRLVRTGERGL